MEMLVWQGKMGIAERWRELSGEKNWERLLDPLDSDLREYIFHYAERAEAVGDAYNKVSKQPGLSLYPMEDFFSKVGLEKANPYKYKVTKFFYARSEIKILNVFPKGESNWIGYVAVATDEGKAFLGRRDILISWRGTKGLMEYINDLQSDLVSASDIFGILTETKVHHGWHSIYTSTDPLLNPTYNKISARDQVLNEVRRIIDHDIDKNEKISITVTGHSLGAAVATLNAMDIVNKLLLPQSCLVTAIVFASPRVGDDQGFAKKFSDLQDNHNLRVLRVNNAMDIVPFYPFPPYTHVGQQLAIDALNSPYLKISPDLKVIVGNAHQLVMYMHGIAGTRGNGQFKLEPPLEDYSIVNKTLDALKDEYNIPVAWWTEKNKSMVQQEDGSWKLEVYKPDPPTN